MDDNAIVSLFWQRSEDALTECGNIFGAYCRKIASNILRNRDDADECVNETWLRAWNAIPPAKPTKLRAFLGKITRNIALDRYAAAHSQKRGNGEMEIALDELAEIPAPEISNDNGEITRAINDFLRSEPSENADIFIKRYWYLMSVKEISVEYRHSESKITSLMFRMRVRLKEKLESEGLL
ncbi:MAG: sigma-70 family RNA polymerase sigma factor [Clostridiales bacterium]|jgi:RNA polymerase sigma-70 factor (ECF subfamily)|nr:sigma-70 family RNA polymerase sigma factor [Clostridiales bacterium]